MSFSRYILSIQPAPSSVCLCCCCWSCLSVCLCPAAAVEGKSGTFPYLRGLENGDTATSKIKQVASGRFGVTPEFLVNADQLEIKVAQVCVCVCEDIQDKGR